jgi:hypothetical protein
MQIITKTIFFVILSCQRDPPLLNWSMVSVFFSFALHEKVMPDTPINGLLYCEFTT